MVLLKVFGCYCLQSQKTRKSPFLTASDVGGSFRNNTIRHCRLSNGWKRKLKQLLNMNKDKEKEIIERFTENLNKKEKVNE